MNITTEMLLGVVLATLLAIMASILWGVQGGEVRQWVAIMATILASSGWVLLGVTKFQYMLDYKEVKEEVNKMRERHFKCSQCGEIYLSTYERYLRENPLAAEDYVWKVKQEHLDWCSNNEEEITEIN